LQGPFDTANDTHDPQGEQDSDPIESLYDDDPWIAVTLAGVALGGIAHFFTEVLAMFAGLGPKLQDEAEIIEQRTKLGRATNSTNKDRLPTAGDGLDLALSPARAGVVMVGTLGSTCPY
jgi:hypothetical protein